MLPFPGLVAAREPLGGVGMTERGGGTGRRLFRCCFTNTSLLISMCRLPDVVSGRDAKSRMFCWTTGYPGALAPTRWQHRRFRQVDRAGSPAFRGSEKADRNWCSAAPAALASGLLSRATTEQPELDGWTPARRVGPRSPMRRCCSAVGRRRPRPAAATCVRPRPAPRPYFAGQARLGTSRRKPLKRLVIVPKSDAG